VIRLLIEAAERSEIFGKPLQRRGQLSVTLRWLIHTVQDNSKSGARLCDSSLPELQAREGPRPGKQHKAATT